MNKRRLLNKALTAPKNLRFDGFAGLAQAAVSSGYTAGWEITRHAAQSGMTKGIEHPLALLFKLMRPLFALGIWISSIIFPQYLLADGFGHIEGVCQDISSKPIMGEEICASRRPGQDFICTSTGPPNGDFVFSFMPPGEYTVYFPSEAWSSIQHVLVKIGQINKLTFIARTLSEEWDYFQRMYFSSLNVYFEF